ncbi:hypothetical protein [Helicobacter sp. T3_23-1056]
MRAWLRHAWQSRITNCQIILFCGFLVIDCHEFATFGKVANSRNDKVICHTKALKKQNYLKAFIRHCERTK